MARWLKWLIAVLSLALLVIVGGLLWLRAATAPVLAGELPLPGLRQAVRVEREPNGVVHILAKDDLDLLFAQGVVHAQDRLWQMELQRRMGAGRLAELLGREAIPKDRYLRTWGFYRAAEAAYARLGEEARALIDAYVAGINAYLASDPPLPPELWLLGLRPEPWRAADVLVWGKLMAYNLADNRRSELRRYGLLARGLTPERIGELMPLYPGEEPSADAFVPPPPVGRAAVRGQTEGLLALDGATRQHLPWASNNWVVAGSRTQSGWPLLANDVHLGMQLPAVFHLVHLQSPGLDVIGASLPGVPLVLIGRNGEIAWGVTNLAADVEDLYLVEEVAGGYRYRGQVRPFETREEVIRVRGGEPVRIQVRETVQGPVVSDVLAEPPGAPPLALRWVGLDPDDSTFEAFLAINRARGWEDFRAAMSRYLVPGQSFVYADRAGHIGYVASGRLPRRRAEHSGLYPVPANGDWDWQGYLDAAELPARLDPPQGYLVSANHRVTPPGYPHQLSLEWGAEPYRAERITELIEARAPHTLGSMRALQLDTLTLVHRDLRPVLAAIEPASASARDWRRRLLGWDGDARVDSVESTVFHAWYAELARLPAAETGTAHWQGYPRYLIRALTDGDPACERRRLSCNAFAAQALERALTRLGPDPPAWGRLHRAQLAHAVLTHTPLAPIVDRLVPMGGSHQTVNVGWYEPEDWLMYHGATYRQVIDLGEPEASVFVLAGGQSANWLQRRYADQIPLWQAGEYLPMRREAYPVAQAQDLVPAPGDP